MLSSKFYLIVAFLISLLSVISFYLLILPSGIAHSFFSRSFLIIILLSFVIFLFMINKLDLKALKAFQKYFRNLSISFKNLKEFISYNKNEINILCITLITLFICFNLQNLFHEYLNINNYYIKDFFYSFIYIFILLPLIILINSYFITLKLSMLLHISFAFHMILIPYISMIYGWNEEGSLKILLSSFILTTYFLFLCFYKIKFYFLIIPSIFPILIMSMFLIEIKSFNFNKKFYNFITKSGLNKRPNIYFLTYENYQSNKIFKNYNIDNSRHELIIKKLGFTIKNDIFSQSTNSSFSIGNIMDVSNKHQPYYIDGTSAVLKTLKHFDYELNAVFFNKYNFSSTKVYPNIYDKVHPLTNYKGSFNSILNGQNKYYLSENLNNDFINAKNEVLKKFINRPQFVYIHSGPGTDPKSKKCKKDHITRFKNNITSINKDMLEDIKLIEQHNPNSIIIINGDHGPFLTKNCNLLQNIYKRNEISIKDLYDRHGAFLAIKWPKNMNVKYPKINFKLLQNLFNYIFLNLSENKNISKFYLNEISDTHEKNNLITGGAYIKNGELFFKN